MKDLILILEKFEKRSFTKEEIYKESDVKISTGGWVKLPDNPIVIGGGTSVETSGLIDKIEIMVYNGLIKEEPLNTYFGIVFTDHIERKFSNSIYTITEKGLDILENYELDKEYEMFIVHKKTGEKIELKNLPLTPQQKMNIFLWSFALIALIALIVIANSI